jgi:hypothetical protein
LVFKMIRKKRVLLALLLGAALGSPLIYRVFWSDYSERALVATALAEQVDLKRQISAELLQGKLAVNLPEVQRTPNYTRVVSRDGTIVLHLDEINTAVVLTPSVKGNEVKWACSGDVMRNLVSACRQPMADSILALVKRAKGADPSSR